MILSSGPAAAGLPPTMLAMAVPSLVALVGYAATAVLSERAGGWLRAALLVGWFAHALAIVVDTAGIGGAQSGVRFGFAPVLSVTAWLVLAVYAIESRFVPLPGVRRTLALLGVSAVALAWLFPGELWLQAQSPWAPLHWVLGIASYGLFGAAVLHAVLVSAAERKMRLKPGAGNGPPLGLPLLRLERLTFRFVAAGFIVLSASLAVGWWFAQPWRWDHKTVFSLLGWLVFAGLLLGRHAFGWRGPKATRWLYAGALLLLLAYVGSRFVMEVLLHRAVPGA